MATAAENLAVAKAWIQAMKDHDAGAMGALASDGVVTMEVAEGEVHEGRDYLVWAYEDLFVGYPDCDCDILNAFASDEQALVEVQWRGTNLGEFRGEAPSNGKADIRIGYVFRLAAGKISGITEYYDMATLLEQLSPSE
jgi:steroid delta-isomerase-like uncharacterized protein